MKFPSKKYYKIDSFTNDYLDEFIRCSKNLSIDDLRQIIKTLEKLYRGKKGKLYVCGNGGSAALSNHFACDHQKILSRINLLKPMITSLSANSAIMTAISNDSNYSQVFVDQLKAVANKNDLLLVISSSGNSKNIIKAIEWANKNKIKTISFTGFDGGDAKRKTKLNIHCNSKNYGIIEAIHQNIMNIISQYIRNKFSSTKKISTEYF